VLGWPLGDPRLVAPAAAMVNLLGDRKALGRPVGIERALAVPGAHVHIYGKAMSGAGRKMGHVTALGATPDSALATAQQAARNIVFNAPADR
jgi:5-(carboxyamino)imidazole ribonucleotide synthase